MPAEIGQLTSLRELNLGGNQLTTVPAEIGQLTALQVLYLGDNQLTSVPAEIVGRRRCCVSLGTDGVPMAIGVCYGVGTQELPLARLLGNEGQGR